MAVTLTTRVDDRVARQIDAVVKREAMDRSTVIRRFLERSLREWMVEQSLRDYEAGRVTLWKAARECGLSLWDMVDEVKKRGVHVPYSLEDLKEDLEALEKG